ncbi:hypothetical protein SKAU_G00014670 [Synaphobranchus kaupii]|uniref:Tyr recombinase domain-containing protein n=1 Tax=Synaphobranchus kaupii TaxID=118154 RepID=A0A9Q1GAR5_SYNKA|nr:hypothetical protein SKAU_G00014670 [Synaphobranchus kaupii]
MNLHAVGLPLRVINTIQSARATSTRTLYDLKWRVFEKWCEEKHVVSFQCSGAEVLCFLQEMLDKGRAFSTIKEESRLNALCPVRALRVYVDRTKGFRKSNQLFVSWASTHRGKPVSRQRLSHWLVEAISRAYEYSGLQVPDGLWAHSTRGMATSWALFRGVSVQDICAAASWATPHTFVRFYRLDVTAPSVAHSVLSVGSPRVQIVLLGCSLNHYRGWLRSIMQSGSGPYPIVRYRAKFDRERRVTYVNPVL